MSTIREQSALLTQHPFFKDALGKAVCGDMSGMERIFYEMMCHTWEKCALESSRVYGKNHRLNHMDIKRELRDQPPPVTLDVRLPAVPVAPSALQDLKMPELDFMLTRTEAKIITLNIEKHETAIAEG